MYETWVCTPENMIDSWIHLRQREEGMYEAQPGTVELRRTYFGGCRPYLFVQPKSWVSKT